MSWKEFPYSASFDFETSRTVHQPMLKVKLSSGQLPFPTRMLVDSGAEDTLINADIAPILGIDITKCPEQQVGGISGSSVGYVHNITIEIPELGDVLVVEAVFVPKLGTSGLLGQTDLFARYNIKFEKSRLSFSLEKVPNLQF